MKFSEGTTDTLEVIAPGQAVLFAESHRHNAIGGPGWMELIRHSDFDFLKRKLISDQGPKHLFVDANLLDAKQSPLLGADLWFKAASSEVLQAYTLYERGPGQRLIHFIRK